MGRAALIRVAAAATAALVTTAAVSQSRPVSTAMTCQQARGFVASRGAAVIGTGGMTYDRFVRDRRYCEATEITSNAFVPTRDDPRCLIGYRCLEPSQDWFGEDS